MSSMPLERIVEQMLMVSDNDAAEVIYRQAAVAGWAARLDGRGRQGVRAELTQLGVWEQGMTINDGSGLARQTKVPADSMVRLLRRRPRQQHPELRAVITGLSVAGVEGSLRRGTSTTRAWPRGESSVARPERSTRCSSLAGIVRTRTVRCWHSRS